LEPRSSDLPHPWRPDPIVRRELKLMQKRGMIGDREIVCELEAVDMTDGPGALVLTDTRLLAVSTTVLRRRMRLVSIPLQRIEQVEAGPTKRVVFRRQYGSLTIRSRDDGAESILELDRITGGSDRAKEIAASIARQRAFLMSSSS
jgi:hypothetical protein